MATDDSVDSSALCNLTNQDHSQDHGPLHTTPTTPTTPIQTLSSKHQFLISLYSGTLSGTISSIVCAPLDIVKTRLQIIGSLPPSPSPVRVPTGVISTLLTILKKDGPKGLFRGLSPTLVTVPTFWGFYFPIYEEFKSFYTPLSSHASFSHVLSAVSAGMVADIVTNPLWVVRTRMQTETLHWLSVSESNVKPMTMLQTTVGLYEKHGVTVFWRGLTASFLGLSHVAIQFPVYERLKVEAPGWRHPERGGEEPLDWLLASAASKVTACLLTYPHEVIRSRMMDTRKEGSVSLVRTTREMVEREGWRSLYRGMHVSLVRVVPNCCLTFMSYEYIKRWSTELVLGTR